MAIFNTAFLTSKISSETGEMVEISKKSNVFRANKVENDVSIFKSAQKNWALPKDKLQIITTFTNNTDLNISDITIKDTISDGATFVEGSLKLGSQEYAEFNPVSGFIAPITIGGSGGEMVMTYDILLDEYLAENTITLNSTTTLELDSKTYTINSNNYEISILNNDVSILKSANTNVVKSGDELTYTITITNEGTLVNTEVFFKDPIPEGTTFVDKSVTINDEAKENYNPEDGFNLSDLNPNDTITIKFKVIVN